MDILIKAGQLFLSLAILVTLHEIGHFAPAKLFKTKVEKFYLFFNPWFSVFKKKIGETEYGLGWLPLGGYVKIAGMIDESMDKEQLKKDPEPWEFRSKPAWQRLIIMIGGVTVNVILAIFIYAMTLFIWGDIYILNKDVKDGIAVNSPILKEIGFKDGDKLISINDKSFDKFSDYKNELMYAKSVKVNRNGEEIDIKMPIDFLGQSVNTIKKTGVFDLREPFKVGKITEGANAEKGGLKKGDEITTVNGVKITYFDEFASLLNSNKGKNINIKVSRNKEIIDLNVDVDTAGKVGFQVSTYNILDLENMGVYEFQRKKYSLLNSIPAGFNKAISTLQMYIKQFSLIFNFKTGAYKGVGGFAAIADMFPSKWYWQIFWQTTAFLSIILAFMNILPIPALDGGHVMFLVYEMITGRKPGEKFLEIAQYIGMGLLLSLMLYANFNDLFKWITGNF